VRKEGRKEVMRLGSSGDAAMWRVESGEEQVD
jgi:hypothetical protein